MASEDVGLVQAQQRLDNGLNHHPQHLLFPHATTNFSCGPPPPQRRSSSAAALGDRSSKSATRELSGGLIDHHHHHYFRRAMFSSAAAAARDRPHQDDSHNWNLSSRDSATPRGGNCSEDDDENEVEGPVDNNDKIINNNNNNSNNNNNNNKEKTGDQKSKPLSSFGLKEGNVVERSENENNNSEIRNAVTIAFADADGEMYYSQYLQGSAEVGQKDALMVENECGFSGREEGVYLSESGEPLREILSDPLTGVLMDDAMILPCGHSFGSGGILHILRMKSCYSCSQTVSEDSVSPNLSLRAAVHAFCREEELQVHRASKRRRERYEQDKGTYSDSVHTDLPRGRGVQFPFAVNDRVIIKVYLEIVSRITNAWLVFDEISELGKMNQGNKRTPPRFVGREAIVTTQCLNGWYVVKTLDNAESVKLQYRSLAKVLDNPSPKPISIKMSPNWQ